MGAGASRALPFFSWPGPSEKLRAGEHDDECEHDRRYRFRATVPEGMFFVGRLVDDETDGERHDGDKHVGRGIDTVAENGEAARR